MKFSSSVNKIVIVLLTIFQAGLCLRCYECVSRVGPGESNPCLIGDGTQLRRVHCIGPSVCAAYHYQSVIPGTPTINHITRGCQSLRYGSTCEDIFNELKSRGEVLPGQHICTTCSSDLCNSSNPISRLSVVVTTISVMIWLGIS
ncbi:hypothetical protein JTB14_036832 [Gonioctena quinquepunctata]|nr:hypothetical protein JTB14_036832 [Gonioctena quinquepunctata]